MIEKKITISYLLISLIISILFIVMYIITNQKTEFYEAKEINNNDPNFIFNIDEAHVDNNNLIISGWACTIGTNLDYVNRKVVLVDSQKNIIMLPTQMQKRLDVTNYLNDGKNYDYSGIKSKVPIRKLKKGEDYFIGLLDIDIEGQETLVVLDYTIKI